MDSTHDFWLVFLHKTVGRGYHQLSSDCLCGSGSPLEGRMAIYLPNIDPVIASVMAPMETNTKENYLTVLLGGQTLLTINDNFHCLLSQIIRRAGLRLWNPKKAADCLSVASKDDTEILSRIWVLGAEYLLEWHSNQVKATRMELLQDDRGDVLPCRVDSRMCASLELGFQLYLDSSMEEKYVHLSFGTFIASSKAKCHWISRTPANFCGKHFNVTHIMPCKKGRLVTRSC